MLKYRDFNIEPKQNWLVTYMCSPVYYLNFHSSCFIDLPSVPLQGSPRVRFNKKKAFLQLFEIIATTGRLHDQGDSSFVYCLFWLPSKVQWALASPPVGIGMSQPIGQPRVRGKDAQWS